MDLERIEKAVREILLAVGEDPEREGLQPVKISQPFFGPTKTAPSSGGAVFLRYSVKYKKENTGKHIPAELYSNLLWKCRLATFTASRSETLQKNPI